MPAAPVGADIVAPDRWVLSEGDGAFRDRPRADDCPVWSFGEEDGVFEVVTNGCRYGSFEQPSALAIPAGSVIDVRVHHFALFAPRAAEAHVGVATSTEVLWERRVPIPSREALIQARVEVETPIAAGEPIYFHLHNHGSNAWRLLGIGVE